MEISIDAQIIDVPTDVWVYRHCTMSERPAERVLKTYEGPSTPLLTELSEVTESDFVQNIPGS
jgi:hypothetical protein